MDVNEAIIAGHEKQIAINNTQIKHLQANIDQRSKANNIRVAEIARLKAT